MNEVQFKTKARHMPPARRRLGWRLLSIGAVAALVAMIASPVGVMGLPRFAPTQWRFIASFVFAAVGLASAIAAWAVHLPLRRRRGARDWSIALMIIAIGLTSLYLLSWIWRR